jgi:hypothetical protein
MTNTNIEEGQALALRYYPKSFAVVKLKYTSLKVTTIITTLGPFSQNFLWLILKIFVTLGPNILRFYRPKVFFSTQISL